METDAERNQRGRVKRMTSGPQPPLNPHPNWPSLSPSRWSVVGRTQLPPGRSHRWPRLPLCPGLGGSGVLGSGRPSAAPQCCDIISGTRPAQSRIQLSSPPSLRPTWAVRVSHARIKGPLGRGSPNRASSPRQSQALRWERAVCENEGLARSPLPSAPLRP